MKHQLAILSFIVLLFGQISLGSAAQQEVSGAITKLRSCTNSSHSSFAVIEFQVNNKWFTALGQAANIIRGYQLQSSLIIAAYMAGKTITVHYDDTKLSSPYICSAETKNGEAYAIFMSFPASDQFIYVELN